jgi:ATP-dependent DNA helicase RecG
MKLPIPMDMLLHGKAVEWERLEFKAGWNPQDVLHTLCAFANDFHNWGGGYILIGVDEKDGQPVLPPAGIHPGRIEGIQKEILELGHRLIPDYHPIMSPYEVEGRMILVLWAGGGQTRPYKAPVSLKKDNREYAYYIRKGAATVRAKGHDETELLALAATVPFDDRVNQTAKISDLQLGLIRDYLQRIGSELFDDAHRMDFLQLCRQMNIVGGPNEFVYPKNVGLFFFNDSPDRFFPQTQIDVVHFPYGLGADSFTETIFKGPIDRILRDALRHIESTVIREKVIKHPDRPEATRRFNYPMAAIEECLCNAIYHRSYETREPVEVRILPDRLTIGSFPGPDPSISDKDLKSMRFISRRYRNRRIGEFLKELDMTEGRGTGIPRVLKAVQTNESPAPVFHTDPDRTFFVAEFPLHPAFAGDNPSEATPHIAGKVEAQVGQPSTQSPTQSPTQSDDPVSRLLLALESSPKSAGELREWLGLKHRPTFRGNYLHPALERGLIENTIPDKPNSRLQEYRLTAKGRRHLAQCDLQKDNDAYE